MHMDKFTDDVFSGGVGLDRTLIRCLQSIFSMLSMAFFVGVPPLVL